MAYINRRSAIGKVLGKIRSFLWPKLLFVLKVVVVVIVLASAWYGFIWLIGKPPIDTTAALIMTWASVIVLLFALFPKVLDRIKRLKVKDFEFELQETVSQAGSGEFITPSDLAGDWIAAEKGDFTNLQLIIERVNQQSNVPVLLIVNAQPGGDVSIPALFTYLFFLDLYSFSTIVVFIAQEGSIHHLSDIEKSLVLGAISGKKALRIFYKRFPTLMRIFGDGNNNNRQTRSPEVQFGTPSLEFVKSLYISIRNEFENSYPRDRNEHSKEYTNYTHEYLTAYDIKDWFNGLLSTSYIDTPLSTEGTRVIRSALEANDDYVLVAKKENLESLIVLCQLASKITRKVLSD